MKDLTKNLKRSRRFMLSALGAVYMTALLFAAPVTVQSGPMVDLYPQNEAIYMVEGCECGGHSIISRVHFDDINGEIILEELADIPFKRVYNMGLTPDGKKLTMMEQRDCRIGLFDIETGVFTDTGLFVHLADGTKITGIVLGGFPPIGPSMPVYGIAGSEDTDQLYRVTPSNGVAEPLGYIYVMEGSRELGYLDLKGADLAFGPAGKMFLWTNNDKDEMHKGIYRVTFNHAENRLEGRHVHSDQAEQIFLTGLAFRFNGRPGPGGDRELVGSLHQSDTMQIFGVDNHSPDVAYEFGYQYAEVIFHKDYPTDYCPMYDPFTHNYGDLASGLAPHGFVPCVYTIGYWQNHPWEYVEGMGLPGAVQLCDESHGFAAIVIPEEEGQDILQSARNNNFSMLTAQLIAAKLNTGGGADLAIMAIISEAEDYLCEKTGGDWYSPFEKKSVPSEKALATGYKDRLDAFNNGETGWGNNRCQVRNTKPWKVVPR